MAQTKKFPAKGNNKFYPFSGIVHKPVFVENKYGTYYNPKVDGQYSRPVKKKQ